MMQHGYPAAALQGHPLPQEASSETHLLLREREGEDLYADGEQDDGKPVRVRHVEARQPAIQDLPMKEGIFEDDDSQA